MHKGVGVLWGVKLDNPVDVGNVEAARRHVGAEQNCAARPAAALPAATTLPTAATALRTALRAASATAATAAPSLVSRRRARARAYKPLVRARASGRGHFAVQWPHRSTAQLRQQGKRRGVVVDAGAREEVDHHLLPRRQLPRQEVHQLRQALLAVTHHVLVAQGRRRRLHAHLRGRGRRRALVVVGIHCRRC